MSIENFIFTFFGWLISISYFILFFLFLGTILLYTRFQKWGRRFVAVASLIIFCTSVIPTGFWMVNYLENRFPEQNDIPLDVTGIIILGGSINLAVSADRKRPCFNPAAGRMIEFVDLAKRYPHLKLLFTGGGRYHDPLGNESYNAKITFRGLGLNPDKVIFEDRSRTTYENALYSYDLVKPKPSEKWVLVTSAYHMPRAVGLFEAAGWNVIPYPVDYHTPKQIPWYFLNFKMSIGLLSWSTGIREIGGMTVNYITGRSKSWIPGDDKDLK